jgi:hypothetical protein
MALGNRRFIHAYSKEGVVITDFDDPAYARAYAFRSARRYARFDKSRGRLV